MTRALAVLFVCMVVACGARSQPAPLPPTSRPLSDDEILTTCSRPSIECERLCTKASAMLACASMARFYGNHDVWGVQQNDSKELYFYERACVLGFAAACGAAASFIDDGRGAAHDRDRMVALLDRGCDLGDVRLCSRVRGFRRDRLIATCNATLPQGKDACLRALPPAIATIDPDNEMAEWERTKERQHLLRISCKGVPRPECKDVPPEEVPPYDPNAP